MYHVYVTCGALYSTAWTADDDMEHECAHNLDLNSILLESNGPDSTEVNFFE